MKKLILFIILLSACFPVAAQNSRIDDMFESYSAVKGYKTIILNSRILQSMSKEHPEKSEIINNIEQIRILSSLGLDENLFNEAMEIAKSGYEQVSSYYDEEDYTSFYFKESDEKHKQFLMVARREKEVIIMDISGNFSVLDISKLSNLGIQK